jgi:hypothetical protein
MGHLDREMEGKIRFSERFASLKFDAQQAARTLNARKEIAESAGWMTRLLKGLICLGKGDYAAVPGGYQKIRVLWRDIRQ